MYTPAPLGLRKGVPAAKVKVQTTAYAPPAVASDPIAIPGSATALPSSEPRLLTPQQVHFWPAHPLPPRCTAAKFDRKECHHRLISRRDTWHLAGWRGPEVEADAAGFRSQAGCSRRIWSGGCNAHHLGCNRRSDHPCHRSAGAESVTCRHTTHAWQAQYMICVCTGRCRPCARCTSVI